MSHITIGKRYCRLFAILCTFLVLSTSGIAQSLAAPAHAEALATADATFLVQWMDLTYANVKSDTVNAPAASRVYAYMGVAAYESLVGGMPEYRSLAGQLKGLDSMPTPAADARYDWQTVSASALTLVLKHLLPTDSSGKAADDLLTKQTASRKSAADAATIEASLKYGQSLGQALNDWIDKDGYIEYAKKPYTLPSGEPWMYVPTSAGTQPVGAYWGKLRTFAMENSDICEVKRTVEFSTEKDSAFYKNAMEVKDIGESLTDWQKDTVNFWIDTPGQTGAPAGHWVSIESQLVKQLDLKLGKAAEMYAVVGMALGDAFISCWETKYKEPLLRPVTYITRYIKRTWQSYVITPPFPSFSSGHSTASAAAAEVLYNLFGTVVFTDGTHTNDQIKLPARTYTSFQAAADEAAISRLYGGIHYRFDNEAGQRQGRCVGEKVMKMIRTHKAS